jgi:hypothetical protein
MNPNVTFDRDEIVVIEDNVEAMKIVVDFGMINHLVPTPPNNVSHFTFQTKTHFGLASNHTGFSSESENGYIVCMLPKTKFTFIDATKFFGEVLSRTSFSGLFEYRFIDVAPLANQ